MSSPTSRSGPVALQSRPVEPSMPSRPLPPAPKQSLNTQTRQSPVVIVAAKADAAMHSGPRNNAVITPVISKPVPTVTSSGNSTPIAAKAAAVVKPQSNVIPPKPPARTVATPDGTKKLVVMSEAGALSAQQAVLAYVADVRDLEKSKVREAQALKEAEEARQIALKAKKNIEGHDRIIAQGEAKLQQLANERRNLNNIKKENDARKEHIKAIVDQLGPERLKHTQECLKTSISKVVGCDTSKIQISNLNDIPFYGFLISFYENNRRTFIIDPHGMEQLIPYFSLCEPRANSKIKELNFTSIGKDVKIPDIDKLAEGLKKHSDIKKISLFCPLTPEEARHLASAHLKTGIVIACGNETAKLNVKQAIESLKTSGK